jgi:hypothetical protein
MGDTLAHFSSVPVLALAIIRSWCDESVRMLPFIAVTHAPRDAADVELRDAQRLSLETPGDSFTIMILGGSPPADVMYKEAFPKCVVFSVGNHRGAGVKGSWDDPTVWERAEGLKPNAVIVDQGSDSHQTESTGTSLAKLLKTTNAMLLFSPPGDLNSKWWNYMAPVHFLSEEGYMRKYNVMLMDNHDVLLCFSNSFDEGWQYPSEVISTIHECQELMSRGGRGPPTPLDVSRRMWEQAEEKRIRDLRDCFRKREAMLSAVSWLDGLQFQLSLVTSRVHAPSNM